MYTPGLVSVVIPTYKRSDTLERAINSVHNQTYRDIEILVVDDNVPGDAYSQSVKRLIDRLAYDNVTLVTQPRHINGAAARNAGIRKSKGEYISFLDDDDSLEEELFSSSMPGTWGFLALELDCSVPVESVDSFVLELDTLVSSLLELESFLLELDDFTVVVSSLCFSEEDSAEVFLEELDAEVFLLEELVLVFDFFEELLTASDFLDEEEVSFVLVLEELDALVSSSSTVASSSSTESSIRCNPLRSSSPTATTSDSVEQLQNNAARINTPNMQTFSMGFLIGGSPFTPS